MGQILLFVAGILVTTCANILLRTGMIRFGDLFATQERIFTDLVRLATSPLIVLGLSMYVIGFFIWLKILSLFEVSKVYPIMVSATVTLVLIGSSLILKENVSFLRIFGVIVLILGIFLVFRS
jgi:drug/metabolite transporter (DMT)-like permease